MLLTEVVRPKSVRIPTQDLAFLLGVYCSWLYLNDRTSSISSNHRNDQTLKLFAFCRRLLVGRPKGAIMSTEFDSLSKSISDGSTAVDP